VEPLDTTASDIPQGGWIGRLPSALRPYAQLARLDRPIGAWLLLFPCWWAMALAGPGHISAIEIIGFGTLFAMGALVMRGAGCTYNDIIDRDIDAKVARTRARPIPSGTISVRGAEAFLAVQLLAGLAILLAFNSLTFILGITSLVLVFTYPFMKRVTYWPQAWLGLTFNWGALLGFSAVAGEIRAESVLLYAAGFFWTLIYDTIYAHQDKADDLLVGAKSLALRLGDATIPWLVSFCGATVVLMAGAGYAAGLGWIYYLLLGLALAQLTWQALRVAIDDPQDCLAKFRSNRLFGWLVLAALVAGQATRTAPPP